MAINLQAVARLNIRPFTQSLTALQKRIAGLYGAQNNLSQNTQTNLDKERNLHERLGRDATRNRDSINRGLRTGISLNNQLGKSVMTYADAAAIGSRNLDAYARNTAGLSAAQRSLATAQNEARRRAIEYNSAISQFGPASQQAITAGRAAQRAIDTRTAAENRANTEARRAIETSRAARIAAEEKAEATRRGTEAARNYTRSTMGMNAARAQGIQLANTLAANEAKLAASYAASGGMRTPQVLAAENATLRASQAMRNYAEQVRKGTLNNHGFNSSLAVQRHMFSDISRQSAIASAMWMALPAIGIGVATSWERSFSDVVRTADPLFSDVPERVEGLRRSLMDAAQSMPSSFGAITEIATLAHQMGIASEDVAQFSRVVAMFSATSGVSVDMAATAFGRLTAILGDARIPFIDMADAILKVGVNSVATEEEIINVTTQISSIAAQAGFSAKEMIALSGALASVRVPPELSRGVITRVFGRIDQAVSQGGSTLQAFARIANTSMEDVKRTWGGAGSADLFNNFLRGLRDMGSSARSELQNLGITSVRDVPVILRLANTANSEGAVGELFQQTLDDAHNAAGETQRQYTIMADTVVGRLKILGNNLLAFFNAVGESGLGMFGDVIRNLSTGLRNFTRDLDKPMKLFGALELPWTNAQALGFAAGAAAIFGGLLMITSIGLQIGNVITTLRQFKQTMSGLNIFSAFRKGKQDVDSIVASFTDYGIAADNAANSTEKVGSVWGKIGKGAGILALLTLATTAVVTFSNMQREAEAATTSSAELAESLASIDVTSVEELDKVLASIEVRAPGKLGLGEYFSKEYNNAKPWVDGIESLKRVIDDVYTYELPEPSGGWWDWDFAGQMALDAAGANYERIMDEAAVKKLDDAMRQMADSGNIQDVIRLLGTMGKSGIDMAEFFETAPSTFKIFTDALDVAGITDYDAAITQLSTGSIPALSDALYGVENASLALDELFDNDIEAMGEAAKKLDDVSASFIKLGEAISEATQRDDDGNVLGFDMVAFTDNLTAQLQAQADWQDNLRYIQSMVGTEIATELSELGEEGAFFVSELAAGIREGTPEAAASVEKLREVIAAGSPLFGDDFLIEGGAYEWFRNMVGDDTLADQIVSQFGSIDIQLLHAAGEGIAHDVLQGIIQEFARTGDLDAALAALNLASPVIKPKLEFDEDGPELDRAMGAVEAKLRQRFKHNAHDLTINADTTIDDLAHKLKTRLGDPSLSEMEIDGNLNLVEAYRDSRAFQVWAKEQGIDIFLGLDDAPARFSLETLRALAEDEELQIALDALPEPAEDTVWHLVEDVNGMVSFIEVDANGQPAEDAATVTINKISGKKATIAIEANPYSFGITVGGLIGRTLGTSYVNLEGVRHFADGGIERYANGGIRSQHRAQIAPAGAMRVWAEPETEGEAYIPFARSKRTRSTAILGQVANRFGYSIVPNGGNVARFADGGFFQAQMFARYTRMLGNTASVSQAAANNGRNMSFTFVNPVTRDPIMDTWKAMQEYGDL